MKTLFKAGYDIGVREELLGHRDINRVMIYTQVLNGGPAGVRTPVDLS